MYTLEKSNTSPLCISLCMLMRQTIPLLTLMLLCRWYKEFTPHVLFLMLSFDAFVPTSLIIFGQVVCPNILKRHLKLIVNEQTKSSLE